MNPKRSGFQQMGVVKKGMLFILLAAMLVGAVYIAYYFIYYVNYDGYKKYLTEYDVEYGRDFIPITESNPDVENMVLAAENELLKLYTRLETGEVALYDKRNGRTVYSNPANANEDEIANQTNINYLKSQFLLHYYNRDVKSGIYDSYSMCVEKDQLTYEGLENGIRYRYDVGEYGDSREVGLVPRFLFQSKLDEICEQLDEQNATSMYRFYTPSDTVEGMLELNSSTMQNARVMRRIQGWLDDIGWTEEDYLSQLVMEEEAAALPISFSVALEYRLEGDSLVVSVPVSMIEERGGGSIHRFQMLTYLGAAGTQEEGYMVLPNGSGSLIHFNNGKTTVANYSQYVYDTDLMLASYTLIENSESARLPLFGICREDSSVLGIIEDGRALSYITAGVSGVFNEYNYVYPSFVLRNADNLFMFGNSTQDIFVLEPELYDVNMTVRYVMLTDKYEGYSGIAAYYREKLASEGAFTNSIGNGNIPFYYDIISGVEETAHFLGVQYLRTFPMTTFEQAAMISDELKQQGVGYQVMNMKGWFNDGYYHDTADTIKIPRSLGGRKGLEDLSRTVQENGGRFYADVAFQKVTWADTDYNYGALSSRYYGAGFTAAFGQVNPATLRMTAGLGYPETLYNLLSPKFLPRYVDRFIKRVPDYDIEGISLRDLGDSLHSDKRRTEIIDREQALHVVLGQLDKIKAMGMPLMMNSGNDYSFAYASDMVNVPTSHSSFLLVDEDIPLYQMIIHGNIDYSGRLMNFTNEAEKTKVILNLIEYGASPRYVFTWAESSKMKNTGLSRYYSTTWEVWKQEAVSVYQEINEVLKHVSGEEMVGHEILGNGIRKTSYRNGVVIYVNYTDQDVTADGIQIPALGYRMEGI